MQNAFPNLKASLDRVRSISDDIDARVQQALKDPVIQARNETTLCAATVILSGFLESFLREVAEEVIGDICNRAVPFNSLPAKIRIAHYSDGALYLREIARREKAEDPVVLAKASDAARRLASVGNLQPPYEILWEAFAETQANPGPDQISAFLKRFHIDDPLPTLAAAMGTTQNNLSLRLRSFMEIRNECAHTGSASKVPTTTELQGFCNLIEQIGKGVVAVFQDTLCRPPYVAAQPTAQANP
ncbi:MAG: HEPN domain-containing protein [Candidatus Acidiferrales bacterium]